LSVWRRALWYAPNWLARAQRVALPEGKTCGVSPVETQTVVSEEKLRGALVKEETSGASVEEETSAALVEEETSGALVEEETSGASAGV